MRPVRRSESKSSVPITEGCHVASRVRTAPAETHAQVCGEGLLWRVNSSLTKAINGVPCDRRWMTTLILRPLRVARLFHHTNDPAVGQSTQPALITDQRASALLSLAGKMLN